MTMNLYGLRTSGHTLTLIYAPRLPLNMDSEIVGMFYSGKEMYFLNAKSSEKLSVPDSLAKRVIMFHTLNGPEHLSKMLPCLDPLTFNSKDSV